MTHSISYKTQDTENTKESIKSIVKKLAHSIPKTIKHYFPHFRNQIQKTIEARAIMKFQNYLWEQ